MQPLQITTYSNLMVRSGCLLQWRGAGLHCHLLLRRIYPAPYSPSPMKAMARRGISRLTTRSEEHTSELKSLMRISYAVFCLKKKKQTSQNSTTLDSKTHIQYIQ